MKITIEFDLLTDSQHLITKALKMMQELTENKETSGAVVPKENPITDIGLTVRTEQILLANNITTLEELHKLSNEELLKLPGLGRRTLKEIRTYAIRKISRPRGYYD